MLDAFPFIFTGVFVLLATGVFFYWRRAYGVSRKDDQIRGPESSDQVVRRDPYNRE
ncbi:MAG: hypothetical protein MUE97_00155 [Phycisphaerales bacterium]|nr:hypothetical protein [Phycisphaerales bacterium]